ncbi:hypothetical protein HID58_032486 [Brassica napus]|uniref:Uncharacterized protein n=1 Tax=Brassica napus TaxID=3708 RepID=A0ABQ8BWI1_BRANA|nr:hypothetical protein HID58_032486 [Brassica napus]
MAILGYRRDTLFFYTYYVIKIIFDMVCQGTVDCLAQAYVVSDQFPQFVQHLQLVFYPQLRLFRYHK